ncbi:hypothetical protein BC826DRAFT_1177301 [Russula brevipes]|nr:hypothetical protein BC826DRAFT_1177301 [Russula brevipes]
MLCIWSTKANIIVKRSVTFAQNAGGKAFRLKNCHPGHWNFCSKPHLNPSSDHPYKPTPCIMGSPAQSHPLAHPHPPATVSPFASLTTLSPSIVDQLTSTQISRASAAAVRISVAHGDFWDSFHLWHSLRWSMHHYHKPGSKPTSRPPFRSPTTAFMPIDFGRSVPTRFATHCLLHGLLRAGKAKIAAKLAEQMMAYGEGLHPLSFSILLRQLNPAASPDATGTVYDRLRTRTPRQIQSLGPRILEHQNVMPRNPLTRLSVLLLTSAREHRWQRTAGMYESVLRACLVQGEILVASLLLALLLEDYHLRCACSRVTAEAERVGAQDTIAYVQSRIPEVPSRSFKPLSRRRSLFLYQSVAKFLEKHCVHVDDPLFPEASQALANLASALDARRIPFTNLATLIKVLYTYPRCQQVVWITLPSGERQSRNAYHYFHGVLLNLLSSLSDRRSLDLNIGQLPAFDLESYNALLNYAMRHRHSLTLANFVIHHMTELREPPLAPSMATYNILLRGSTLMRRNDIAECILRTVWKLTGDQPETSILHSSPRKLQGRNSQLESYSADIQSQRHCHRIRELLENNRKCELSIPKPNGPLEPDNTLLTSYIAHLVATGRPEAVATLITRVIPELVPSKEPASPIELNTRWQACVVRGVTLGPHFFAVALNALRKAGLRRFAERVWALARAAETKSLQSNGTSPWCLSVHAYTTMLQLYAEEERRWRVDRMSSYAEQLGHPFRPRASRGVLSGMRKGLQVFRALPLAADKVRQAALRARKDSRKWKQTPSPPRADAKFYNAALTLIRRQLGMRPRHARPGSRWRWNSVLRKARHHMLLTGRKQRGWTPELEEIAKSLRSSGYALPIGFRLRLVGRDERVTPQDKTDCGARPYSFGKPVHTRFASHHIPTVKRKGLPLRRRWHHSGGSDMERIASGGRAQG